MALPAGADKTCRLCHSRPQFLRTSQSPDGITTAVKTIAVNGPEWRCRGTSEAESRTRSSAAQLYGGVLSVRPEWWCSHPAKTRIQSHQGRTTLSFGNTKNNTGTLQFIARLRWEVRTRCHFSCYPHYSCVNNRHPRDKFGHDTFDKFILERDVTSLVVILSRYRGSYAKHILPSSPTMACTSDSAAVNAEALIVWNWKLIIPSQFSL